MHFYGGCENRYLHPRRKLLHRPPNLVQDCHDHRQRTLFPLPSMLILKSFKADWRRLQGLHLELHFCSLVALISLACFIVVRARAGVQEWFRHTVSHFSDVISVPKCLKISCMASWAFINFKSSCWWCWIKPPTLVQAIISSSIRRWVGEKYYIKSRRWCMGVARFRRVHRYVSGGFVVHMEATIA